MIIEEKQLHIDPALVYMDRITSDTLFFDIETTGFSPKTAHLYMIGCCYYKENQFYTIQWFDDDGTSEGEVELLNAFEAFLRDFKSCISFNGSTFDFPFLLNKYDHYDLISSLPNLIHKDIYKLLRPYKEDFHMEDLKQKSLEAFLGINRQDKYSGGELIPVYKSYVKTKDESAYTKLMLHNYEDLEGMLLITPVYAYFDFFNKTHELLSVFHEEPALRVTLKLSDPVPVPVTFDNNYCFIELYGARATMTIKGRCDTLKYFYEDYKNYYYLPYEDTAIHKSVASFVDPAYRKKATKDTCYIKKSDFFIPQFKPEFKPVYKETASCKLCYITWDTIAENPDHINRYLHHLLSSFGRSDERPL